jgi:hypothetical protein
LGGEFGEVGSGGRGLAEHLVGGFGVPAQGVQHVGEVEAAAVGDRFACVDRFGDGQFVGVGLDQIGEAEQDGFAFGGGDPAPVAFLEGGAGRGDGPVDVDLAPGGDLRDDCPVAGATLSKVAPSAALLISGRATVVSRRGGMPSGVDDVSLRASSHLGYVDAARSLWVPESPCTQRDLLIFVEGRRRGRVVGPCGSRSVHRGGVVVREQPGPGCGVGGDRRRGVRIRVARRQRVAG